MKTKFQIGLYQLDKKDFRNAFHVNNLTYALFPKDNAVTSSIIEGWQYEPYLFDFLDKNQIDCAGKDIIDVGANNGNFAVDFAHLVGDHGRVFSFEPQRIIYYQLCTNVFLNGLDNVFCQNVAIGNGIDKEVFIQTPDYHSKEEVNFGDVRVSNNGGDVVQQRALDSYTFRDIAFIKIDVQGYESYVIDGAKETIKKHRPYMFIEFENHLLKEQGTSEDELKAKIEELGYVVKQFEEGKPYQTYSGKCLDCVAIPKERFEKFNYIIP
jgi:FkbM family methyltransferase